MVLTPTPIGRRQFGPGGAKMILYQANTTGQATAALRPATAKAGVKPQAQARAVANRPATAAERAEIARRRADIERQRRAVR